MTFIEFFFLQVANSQLSEEDKAKAEEYKNRGNELMREDKFCEACEAYSKAIKLDETNPIYYCNR